MKGTTATEGGSFIIESPAGDFLLAVRLLGYQDHFSGITVTPGGDEGGQGQPVCSRKYVGIYQNPQFHINEGENHRFSKHTRQDVDIVTKFFASFGK